MSDPNEVSAEVADCGFRGVVGMRMWKVVTVSGDDMQLGLGLCIDVLSCCCGVIRNWTGRCICCWLGDGICGCIGCYICSGTGYSVCCGTGCYIFCGSVCYMCCFMGSRTCCF